jgi:hypothetical protein
MTSPASWLRCYRCWSQNLEVQVHYEGILKVDAETGDAHEPVEGHRKSSASTACMTSLISALPSTKRGGGG